MWTKTTCEQENLRSYQACLRVCQKGILENQGSRSLGQRVLNRLGPLKVCLQIKHLKLLLGIGKPVSFSYTLRQLLLQGECKLGSRR